MIIMYHVRTHYVFTQRIRRQYVNVSPMATSSIRAPPTFYWRLPSELAWRAIGRAFLLRIVCLCLHEPFLPRREHSLLLQPAERETLPTEAAQEDARGATRRALGRRRERRQHPPTQVLRATRVSVQQQTHIAVR